MFFFFFFQAEDGIRDWSVTGVQTCALPICAPDAQKNEVKPWLVAQWCLAPTADPAFVWHMEDVLDVYQRPYDSTRPVVCLDETSRQLLGEVRPPLPTAPGHPLRRDPEYVRGGVANLFLVTEPLRGWRRVSVSDRRTRQDFG